MCGNILRSYEWTEALYIIFVLISETTKITLTVNMQPKELHEKYNRWVFMIQLQTKPA